MTSRSSQHSDLPDRAAEPAASGAARHVASAQEAGVGDKPALRRWVTEMRDRDEWPETDLRLMNAIESLLDDHDSLVEQLEAAQDRLQVLRPMEAAVRLFVGATKDAERRRAIGEFHNAVADLDAYEDAVLLGHDRDARDALSNPASRSTERSGNWALVVPEDSDPASSPPAICDKCGSEITGPVLYCPNEPCPHRDGVPVVNPAIQPEASEPLVDSPSAQGVDRETEPDRFSPQGSTSSLSGSETSDPAKEWHPTDLAMLKKQLNEALSPATEVVDSKGAATSGPTGEPGATSVPASELKEEANA